MTSLSPGPASAAYAENQRKDLDRPIPVLEIFGPTVQGEGMSIGRKTMFVRTAGCDYRCSWCDSAFTWDGSAKEEIRSLSPSAIWEELQVSGASFDHVTLSGGNPLLLPQLGGLVRLLREKGIRTAVETQGTVWQDWALDVDEITLSPKPPSSGMTTDMKLLNHWMEQISGRGSNREPGGTAVEAADTEGAAISSVLPSFSLKIVIFGDKDLDYAALLHKRYPQAPLILQTGNPETLGGDPHEVAVRLLTAYEQLIDRAMKRTDLEGVRILPQLHTLVWGNKRGV
jgi:7-carboxy-7-deazaguanine synthase